jgi:CheY-like chemotaxis protein
MIYVRTLLVDPEGVLAEVAPLLAGAGHDVRAAASPAEVVCVVGVVGTWRPDLIVTTAAACEWLRRQVTTARIPIVLCSIDPDPELATLARASGADAHVSLAQGLEALPARLAALRKEIVW